MAKQHPIFTIGYEGASVAAFVAALREAGVALVLDIRRRPSLIVAERSPSAISSRM